MSRDGSTDRMFPNTPKFIRAQLIQDWAYVKRGKPASARERIAQCDCRTLMAEFPYIRGVRLLRFYYDRLGKQALRTLIEKNDTRHKFEKACKSAAA